MVKKTKNTHSSIEKILALAGFGVVLLGCFANIYGASINQRFIHDGLDLLYYLRYVVLLGGGFVVGYTLIKPKLHDYYTKLYNGALYAVLAVVAYELLDILRVSGQHITNSLPFPWGRMLFEGEPLLALAIALLAVTVLRSTTDHTTSALKAGIVSAFAISQLYFISTEISFLATSQVDSSTPLWLGLFGVLASPLIILAAAYLILSRVKHNFDRLFYAVFITLLASTLMTTLWEFRTDASMEATNAFTAMTTAAVLAFSGLTFWAVRKVK